MNASKYYTDTKVYVQSFQSYHIDDLPYIKGCQFVVYKYSESQLERDT